MTVKMCQQCDGSGYHYDQDRQEVDSHCLQCDGTGFVESGNSFHVELTLTVDRDARFSDRIHEMVRELGWQHDVYPIESDYLLQLLTDFFNKQKKNGIVLKSIAVGKEILHVKMIDMGGDNNQPTLF